MKITCASLLIFASSLSFAQIVEHDKADSFEIDRLIHTYQFDKALAVLNQVEDSLSIDVLQQKGYCYFQMGEYENAIQKFEEVVRLDSMNTHALFQLAQLYARDKHYLYTLLADLLLETDMFDIADSVLTRALRTNSSPQLTLLLAKAQLGGKKYAEVIKTTEKLLLKYDTLPAYARLMGISYFQLHEYDKVIPCMDFLLRKGLKAEWMYYYQGVSYQHLNKPDSAITFLNKAIEEGISDNISQYYVQLATSYENVKDFKSAIKYYKAAYENSKKDILLYHLGRSYNVYYKDKSQAIAYFKRYLNSDDTIKVAKEYTRSRLNELEFYR